MVTADTPCGPSNGLALRLRLKRSLLIAAIASLGLGALIAIGLLIFGGFTRTTERVLETLAALTAHSAIGVVNLQSLDRRFCPKLSGLGLILFALNFLVVITCIWWPAVPVGLLGFPSNLDTVFSAVLGSVALAGYYVLAIPCEWLREHRRWRPLPELGLACCIVGLTLTLGCVWASRTPPGPFGKATAIAGILAFSISHCCLLARISLGPSRRWGVAAVAACIWAVAGTAIVMIVDDNSGEPLVRLLGALGVADACGTFALLILASLRQVQNVTQLTTTVAEIRVSCPRCGTDQVMESGPSACRSCGLKFRIEIEEPRCERCGYLLWRLAERRCPECGTPF
jgi:hypothetical protein